MVNLKISLGTVNYDDFLRVIACKVSSPTVIAYETYIDVPVTNYNFIIPGLDPENYIVSYYDAPTNPSTGTLVMQLIVNALTSDILYERRFYTCGGEGAYDPVDGSSSITDPYLIGKNVTGVFKEGFRYFDPVTEFSFDGTTGQVSVLNGTTFSEGEKFIVEIKYNVQQTTGSGAGGGLYSKTITVTEATKTLTSSDIDARVRCVGTAPTQVITLPSLATFGADRGLYFDNSCGGEAVQVKLLLSGTERIKFNGFMAASDLFAEFWVSKGEHLKLIKLDDNYWEVIGDYAGVHVGEKVTLGYNSHPNTLVENAQLIDGDEYPRLWWWIKNVLPATHYYITDTVTDMTGGFTPDPARLGQFAIHSTLKKFRMPYTCMMTERGLTNFITQGIPDSGRPVNYPGGFQNEMTPPHTHTGIFGDTAGHGSASSSLSGVWKWLVNIVSAGSNTGQVSSGKTGAVTGDPFEGRVKNTGVIYARRI